MDNRVQNLIYASDIAVVMGQFAIVRGNESISYPRSFLLPDGPSKAQAEKMIIDACGNFTGGGPADPEDPWTKTQLKTMVLRLVNLYGELDSLLWPRLVRLGAYNHGHVPCVGTLKTKVHLMYVGNAAWALICAHDALSGNRRNLVCIIESCVWGGAGWWN
ncbi:hypothetical protein ACOMHN_014866 [Nucella lapillus]